MSNNTYRILTEFGGMIVFVVIALALAVLAVDILEQLFG